MTRLNQPNRNKQAAKLTLRSTFKLSIWEQLKEVLNSKILSTAKKQEAIEEMRMGFIVNKEANGILINKPILDYVGMSINDIEPELCTILEEEMSEVKAGRKAGFKFPLKHFIQITLCILIIALENKEQISRNLFHLQLTIFLGELLQEDQSPEITEDSIIKLNRLFQNCITANINIPDINVKGFSKEKKNIGRCLLTLIDKLIDKGGLRGDTTVVNRPLFEVVNQYQKREKPMNILTLNYEKKIQFKDRIFLFFKDGPQLTKIKISNKSKLNHAVLTSGVSELQSSSDLNYTLQSVANLSMEYDINLFKEALEKVKSEELFEIHNKYSLEETSQQLIYARQSLREHTIVYSSVFQISQLKTLIQYFTQYNSLKIKLGLEETIRKGKHGDQTFSFPYNKEIEVVGRDFLISLLESSNLKEDGLNLINNYLSTIDKLKNYLQYKREELRVEEALSNIEYQLPSSYLSYLKNISDDALPKVISNLQETILLLTKGLQSSKPHRFTNFTEIFRCYNQTKANILDLGLQRFLNDYEEKTEEMSILIENNTLYKEYIIASKRHSLNTLIKFKSQLMELYAHHKFYYQAQIGVNGRLVMKGFTPHPHSGMLFRFSNVLKEKVHEEGLNHLKCCISYAFKNHFNTHKEHIQGVNTNLESIQRDLGRSVETFVYVSAYNKVMKGESIGVLLRVDQKLSGLTISGVLANCPYYLEISNFNDKTICHKPYLRIGEEYIKPALLELKEKWKIENQTREKLPVGRREVFNMLDKTLIPNVLEKSFLKYIIMPHLYNLTNDGIEEKLLDYLNKLCPEMKGKPLRKTGSFKALALKIWHALNKSSSRVHRLHTIINKMQEYMLKEFSLTQNTPYYSSVIEHEDCTVKWDYREIKYTQVNGGDNRVGYSRTVKVHQKSKKSDYKKAKRAFMPLLIHSIDACIIRKTIRISTREDNFTPVTIHDAASAHPNYMTQVFKNLKHSFYEAFLRDKLTNKEYLEKIGVNPTLEYMDRRDDFTKENKDKILVKGKDLGESKSTLNSGLKEEKLQSVGIFKGQNYDYA